MLDQTLPLARARSDDGPRDRSMDVLQYATAIVTLLAALVLTVAR